MTSGENSRPKRPPVQRLPIFVGVVGKIDFAAEGNPAGPGNLSTFAHRFRIVISELDRRLPLTPKVLVCGGAAGVDLAAARTVLERADDGLPLHPAWSVVIVLPFDRALFKQDFCRFPEDWRLFCELADDRRVAVKTLQPLLLERFDDIRVETPHLARVSNGQLSRKIGEPAVRRQHYEQAGLWIARSATILIAAMPATESAAIGNDKAPGAHDAKPGGTARVVAFRRAAMPDKTAADVLERSSDLLTASPIEEPDGGYVLLIDPTDKKPADPWFPAEVLRPIQRLLEVERDIGPEAMRQLLYQQPGIDSPSKFGADTPCRRLRAALHVPRAFERFHRRQLPIGCQPWLTLFKLIRWFGIEQTRWLTANQRQWHSEDVFCKQTPTEFLDLVRRTKHPLDCQQKAAHDWSLGMLWAMIGILLAAVASYEIYIEFWPEDAWWLVGYVGLVTTAAIAAVAVNLLKLQLRDEDFRGLKEMLRVQIAWWDAGIPRAVDRIHLRSIDSDLRRLREAGAAIVLWAQLRCRDFQPGIAMRTKHRDGPGCVRKWVDGQVEYYQNASERHRRNTLLVERFYMVALTASLLTQAALAAWQCLGTGSLVPALVQNREKAGLAGVLILLGVATATALTRKTATAHYKVTDVVLLFVAGAILAALTLLTATTAAPLFVKSAESDVTALPHYFHALVLTMAVMLLACAGMGRFYTEKRNHSAQAAHYSDMRRAFRRAQNQLATAGNVFTAPELALIKEIGELALDENESWLKAHRDRPTRPMASG